MQHIVFLFLVLSTFFVGHAQEFYYAGTIDEKLSVQMQLSLDDDSIEGFYYYDTVGRPLFLKGSLDNNQVRLEEYTQEQQLTGVFSGQFSNAVNDFATEFKGDWIHAYGNQLSFSLTKVAEYAEINMQQTRITSHSFYPFFLKDGWHAANDLLQDMLIERQTRFFREAQAVLKDGELYNGWGFDDDVRIVYYSDDLLSLQETLYAYTGGAHPNTSFASHLFSQEDDEIRVMKLQDLFTPNANFMAILNPFILNDLLEQEAAWIEDGSISRLTEDNLSTFTVSPEGLRFIFEQYAVGPYAQGVFEVLMPYELLKNLIPDGSPLSRFL